MRVVLRSIVMTFGALVLLLGGAEAANLRADSLLAIDQNRSTVIDRVVREWGEALAQSNAGIDGAQLREMLYAMRADQLLAASLAGNLEGLRNVVAAAIVSESAVKPSLLQAKALGDGHQDVVYVPVTPCRLVETRGTFAAVYQGGGAFTPNQIRTYTLQGGNGVCLTQLPGILTPSAIQLQVFGIPTTTGSGDIEILPQGGTFGSTATMVYLGNNLFTTAAATSLANLANKQISVQVRGGGAHVAMDVVGYFRAPLGGFVTGVTAGTGLTGGTITGTGTIAADTSYLQRRVSGTCAAGSSIRTIAADGTVICESDDAGTGTVTSVGSGTGLSGGPITTSGTLSADTTYLQRRVSPSCAVGSSIRAIAADGTVTCQTDNSGPANAFVQNGNAFGAQAILGTTDAFDLDVRVNNSRVMRYERNAISPNVIGGSPANSVTLGVRGATIGGGGVLPGGDPEVIFPAPNRITDAYGTIGGGYRNLAGDDSGSTIDRPLATVGGGFTNEATGSHSTIGGGSFNTAGGEYSTVGGGSNNYASGRSSTIGGGASNVATGDYSWAGGRSAMTTTAVPPQIPHHGAFVWADSNNVNFNSAGDNEFAVRATGGARFVTAIDGSGNPVRAVRINPNGELEFGGITRQMLNLFGAAYAIGVQPFTTYFRTSGFVPGGGGFSWFLGGSHVDAINNPGAGGIELMRLASDGTLYVTGGAVAPLSDRAAKQDFAMVDPGDVLERVARLPLSSWSYKANPGTRHIGPMAQDFRMAFGVGDDDARSIATVDADGVALAAIQGLNAKLEAKVAEQSREIAALRRAVDDLLARNR